MLPLIDLLCVCFPCVCKKIFFHYVHGAPTKSTIIFLSIQIGRMIFILPLSGLEYSWPESCDLLLTEAALLGMPSSCVVTQVGACISRYHLLEENVHNLKASAGASLVAQWSKICLAMQGTEVEALFWDDPTCLWVTKPMCPCATDSESELWSPQATATEPHAELLKHSTAKQQRPCPIKKASADLHW